MISYHNRQVAHQEIDHIFQDLFPGHGMTARPSQIELSHKMLDAMIHSKIALSDAGTGIGKTYAYLVAGVSFSRALRRESVPFRPVLVSTSSIALQTAVMEEYMHSTMIETVKAEGDVMGQADSYIRRVRNECNLSHLEDIFDLYDFVPNNDLRILLAAFHN